jgi:hypothetical protein
VHKWSYIYARKKSKASHVPVVTKIRSAQRHFISCTDFHQIRRINLENKKGISLAPLVHGFHPIESHKIYKFITVFLAVFVPHLPHISQETRKVPREIYLRI